MVSNSQTANIDAKQSISIMRCLVLFQRLHELKVIRSENEVVSHEASMPSYSLRKCWNACGEPESIRWTLLLKSPNYLKSHLE